METNYFIVGLKMKAYRLTREKQQREYIMIVGMYLHALGPSKAHFVAD